MTSINALAALLEAYFNIFCGHTHTETKLQSIAFPLLRMHVQGNNTPMYLVSLEW